MTQDTLYIVMPAYNEEANIQNVLEQWYPLLARFGSEHSRLLVIDDGSRDQTGEMLRRFAQDHPMLIPISRPNKGHGATVYELYRRAIADGADYIFQTDSDGQTDPSQFAAFWSQRNEYDMIIGWRRGREDGFSRKIVTRVLRLALWCVLGVWVKDANTPFRLMRRDSLQRMLAKIPESDFLTNALLSAAFEKFGQRVRYHPITFLPRQGGVNSINVKKIIRIGIRAVKSWLHLRGAWRKDV